MVCTYRCLVALLSGLPYGTVLAVLFYPPSSVLQLTSTLSVPLLDLPHYAHQLIYDWGFQMNYDFPARPDSFYNAPIWPASRLNQRRALLNGTTPVRGRHCRDFSAGELYAALNSVLEEHGLHKECLLRAVCELARFPFGSQPGDLLSATLSLLLKPSLHRGFDPTELAAREAYELAEHRGASLENCELFYAACKRDPLALFSRVA